MRRGELSYVSAVDLEFVNLVAGKNPVLSREGGEPPPLRKLFCHAVAYLFCSHVAA
jgi:hypothetical protein